MTDDRDRFSLIRSFVHRRSGADPELGDEGRLASFDRGAGWLNSHPLTPDALRGRVVLVDFWTFTCVNWLRTLPYRRAWDAKYRALGLTIVGVHTPEFEFERDPENVAAELPRLGVTYPVVLDPDYGIWDEFANHYWPALYLADATGRIRYHHFGEGEYLATEMVLQRLLADAGADVDGDLVTVAPQGLEVAADWRTLRSPETYLGAGRGGPVEWGVDDGWSVLSDRVRVVDDAGGRLWIDFHARDANLVMRSRDGRSIPFRVLLDGAAPGGAAGTDIDPDGRGELTRPGTYQVIRQPGPIGDRRVEIEMLAPGAEAYCVTFG